MALQERQRFEAMYSDQVDSASQFANELDDTNKLLDEARGVRDHYIQQYARAVDLLKEADASLEQRETNARLERERDEARERVRVLEARLEKATAVIKALEATQLVAGVLNKAYDEWRGLAGAETEAGR